jgi:hypothetical protein
MNSVTFKLMPKIMLRGNEVQYKMCPPALSTRTAQQHRNKIVQSLKKLGIETDEDDTPIERMPMKKASAFASWYGNNMFCFISHNSQDRYVDNLGIIANLIDLEVQKVINDEEDVNHFLQKYEEDQDILNIRKKARKTLGITEDCMDMDEVNKAYKKLSRNHHPDMESGDEQKFKKINDAHKILKRELS